MDSFFNSNKIELIIISILFLIKMDYLGYKVYENGDILRKDGKGMLKLTKDRYGYFRVIIMINKKQTNMKVHRLVALCHIPNPDNKPTVDHILREEITNNNVNNLRWATSSEQAINTGIRSDNTSGVKGVIKTGKSWRAYITINGKKMTKYCKTFEKAVEKRKELELEHHVIN